MKSFKTIFKSQRDKFYGAYNVLKWTRCRYYTEKNDSYWLIKIGLFDYELHLFGTQYKLL